MKRTYRDIDDCPIKIGDIVAVATNMGLTKARIIGEHATHEGVLYLVTIPGNRKIQRKSDYCSFIKEKGSDINE